MTTPELQQFYPDWEIVRLLGEGSFGQVYEIQRRVFDAEQRAALKVIRIPKSPSEVARAQSEGMDEASLSAYFHGFVKSLSDEIALLSRLKGNSNIVSYEDHMIIPNPEGGSVGWTILIRMELLTPLLRHMRAQTMNQREVLRLGLDLCRALTLCQREHIIHRDIKPDNIFVSPAGDYKLGDFGVARELEQTAAGLSRKGTFSYMAPEVFNGKAYNATVDIYSLGVVLYALLNGGRTPFLPLAPQTIKPSDREQAQTRQLSGEALPPLLGVNPAWDDIIAKACAHDPRQRYQSAGELAEALQALAGEFEAGGTVSLWSSVGSERPGTAVAVPTYHEPSRWIDGTPVKTAKEQPAPEPEPEPVPPPKKKLSGKLIAIIAAAAVLLGGGIAALVLLLNSPKQEQLLEYRDYAQQLCQPGMYEECAAYINSILPQLGRFKDGQAVGEIYYLQGESYFEQEQYQAAIAAYEAAGTYLTDSLGLYRDTAIAYARSGDINRAESFLQNMRALPDSKYAVALLLGEIAFVKGEYEEALDQLRNGIVDCSDYARYRAILICDKAYRNLGRTAESIGILGGGLNVLPLVYHSILNERLADALSRDGQYQEAVALFEQLRDGGDTRLGTLQNIGLLYQQLKQYGKARAAFEAMREAYPKQHEGPMRLCYLVLAEQAEKANEQRDYAEAQRLYTEAKRLYDERPVASGEDMEMGRLAGTMEELERAGWGKVVELAATAIEKTSAETTKKQNTWASQYAETLRIVYGYSDPNMIKIIFTLMDINGDGIPEMICARYRVDNDLWNGIQDWYISSLGCYDETLPFYEWSGGFDNLYYLKKGNDILFYQYQDNQYGITYWISKYQNSKEVIIGYYRLKNGTWKWYEFTDSGYKESNIVVDNIDSVISDVRNAKEIKLSHTYTGGNINLEDYWHG